MRFSVANVFGWERVKLIYMYTYISQECSRRKAELEEVVKGLTSEVSEEEVTLKKTGRSLEVVGLQVKSLEERERELERVGRETGSTMDAGHLKKLETQVKAFEKGLREGERKLECVHVCERERERERDRGREGGKERERDRERERERERERAKYNTCTCK